MTKKKGTTVPTEHSNVMGGSTAARRTNCPGSLKAENAMPESAPSGAAERGSMLHACMERLLEEDCQSAEDATPVLAGLLGETFGFDTDPLTEELVNAKLWPAFEAWLEVLHAWDFEEWLYEEQVSLDHIIPGAFGTADVVAVDTAGRLHILDWKFGDGIVVPPDENLGLGFYANAALHDTSNEAVQAMLKRAAKADRDPGLMVREHGLHNEVVLHIVQPRSGSSKALHSWQTTHGWLSMVLDAFKEAAGKFDLPDPPRAVGNWCTFCAARPVCGEHRRLIVGAMEAHTPSNGLSAVELASALTLANQFKGWISEVVALAQKQAEAGMQLPGYKLVSKRPRRVWADPEAAEKALRGKHKVGEIFKRELISPTQAEKLDRDLYRKKLKDMVSMHSSGVTLVPDSDPRPSEADPMAALARTLPKLP